MWSCVVCAGLVAQMSDVSDVGIVYIVIVGNVRERHSMEDLDIDGRIILILIL
jgi:hypothetical protein